MRFRFGETSSWLLWPDSPGIEPAAPDFEFQGDDVIDVHRPRVFEFAPAQPGGRAALVLAGGGYTKLVVSYEGVDVARWLNSLGIHAFLLVHRFPQARWAVDGRTGAQAPVDDAGEAMRQIRARFEPLDSVGVVGLSSGGHLAACLASNYPPQWRAPPSSHAHQSSRPDFLIVGYAPISTNATGRTVVANKPPLPPPEKQALYECMQPDAQLVEDPPPAFIVYSAEDPVVPVENAYRLGAALRAGDATVETHIYARGAHGFALRATDLPIGQWPNACAAWLQGLPDAH
ncbi:MAG TPA: alpha/beta hydrolase [Steroidobacteraceae bacterium]|nr:alpha/beta hydrolase [Steroidobacteraceae bacterium]